MTGLFNFQMKNLIIGISGFATSGKDTCALLVQSHLEQAGIKSKIFSFAYALKKDIDHFCTEKIGITAFTSDPMLKPKIRPILISYGQIQRNLSNGLYWINKINPEILNFFEIGGSVAIIPDLRFKEFEYDELDYIKSHKNNILVNVERIDPQGNPITAAHQSEQLSYNALRQESDIKIKWKSSSDSNYLNDKILDLKKLINLKLDL